MPTSRSTPKRRAIGGGGKHTYAPPQWRFAEMLEGLGSSTDVAKKAVARGYPRIPQSSIAGWRMRNSIPPFWVPVFIQMALDEKLITKIEDLRVPNKE
jgi:hypothetical protein